MYNKLNDWLNRDIINGFFEVSTNCDNKMMLKMIIIDMMNSEFFHLKVKRVYHFFLNIFFRELRKTLAVSLKYRL